MHDFITTRMPVLSAQIHRIASPHDEASDDTGNSITPEILVDRAWTWSEAERRLGEAYERGGIMEWAAVAYSEIEAEGRAEYGKGAELQVETSER